MTRAATVNGVGLLRQLTKVHKPKVQRATARWSNDDGEIVESQDVIMCPAKEWPGILRSRRALASWSVLTFGQNIVAVSPPSKVV